MERFGRVKVIRCAAEARGGPRQIGGDWQSSRLHKQRNPQKACGQGKTCCSGTCGQHSSGRVACLNAESHQCKVPPLALVHTIACGARTGRGADAARREECF